jgi:calcineurin-like phosphoesterase family protein
MARYLISDHHFGHANIIEYCDRPFSSPGQMDSEMLDRFHEVVEPADTIVHLGDVAMDMRDGEETIERFEQLGADLLVRGNHDVGLAPDEAPFPVVEACILSTAEREFYCTHRPENIPSQWDGWAIHGHTHNNETDQHPFFRSDAKRVNASAELLNYRPVTLSQIEGLIEQTSSQTRFRDITDAREDQEEA